MDQSPRPDALQKSVEAYVPPAIEQALTGESLAREVFYAGGQASPVEDCVPCDG